MGKHARMKLQCMQPIMVKSATKVVVESEHRVQVLSVILHAPNIRQFYRRETSPVPFQFD
jgi:hypothetical protein